MKTDPLTAVLLHPSRRSMAEGSEVALSQYGIEDEDAEAVASCFLLSGCSFLDLSHNQLTDRGVEEIITRVVSSHAKSCSSRLTSLSLASNLAITDESVICAIGKNVQHLNLSGNRITATPWLADDTVLLTLDLSHCKAVGADEDLFASCLSQNSTLKELSLSSNGLLFRAPLATALSSAALTSLDLSNNVISLDNAVHLAEAICVSGTLRKLVLARCALGFSAHSLVNRREASDRFSASLATNSVLVELDLTENMLHNLPLVIDGLAEPLGTNTTLQVLNLSNNNMNDRDVVRIAEGVEANTSLVRLDLSMNAIEDIGATQFAIALSNRTDALNELNLARNKIAQVGCERLAEMLASNSSLSVLALGHNPLGSGASWVLSSLMTNGTLSSLSIEDNLICADLVWMSEMLSSNSTLTMINMDGNFMGDLGVCACADAFMSNSSLTALSLGENDIGDCGAERLAEALIGNRSLTQLQLAGNKIRDKGAGSIAEALVFNSSLRTLNLLTNEIAYDGSISLANAMQSNQTLMEFRLTIDEDAQDRMSDFDTMLYTFAQVLSSPGLAVLDLRFSPNRKDDGLADRETAAIRELFEFSSAFRFARALQSCPPPPGSSAELSSSLDLGKHAPKLGLPLASENWGNRRILASWW